MKEKPLWVKGCPLCDIFSKKDIITKLYWPENIDDIPNSEYVIVSCKSCNIPMVVFRDHVESINSDTWGRLIYKCKNLFGSDIKFRYRPRTILDHFHVHIIK